MGIRTAWQAIAQPPGRFLASSWPWRSLAYLLCGIAPSAAVAAGVIALFSRPASRAAPVVLPLVALALLGSGPVVARYERWRLRLVHTGLDPDRRRAEGTGHRALEAGYGVVCVVVLWLIDLAVVALSLFLSAGLTVMALRSADSGGGVQAAMLVVAVALLPVAAYPITAWAGARAALARAILAPRGAGAGPAAGRGHPVAGPAGRRVRAGAAADRARPARRRPAAAGRAHRGARPGQARPGAGLGRRGAGRHRPRAGQAGAGGAAGADPRRPPAGADRPRAARGRRRRRRPLAGAGRHRRRPAPAPAGRDRGRRLLRGLRGPGQRGQAQPGQPGVGAGPAGGRRRWSSR